MSVSNKDLLAALAKTTEALMKIGEEYDTYLRMPQDLPQPSLMCAIAEGQQLAKTLKIEVGEDSDPEEPRFLIYDGNEYRAVVNKSAIITRKSDDATAFVLKSYEADEFFSRMDALCSTTYNSCRGRK